MAQTKRGAKRCLKDGTAYPTGLSRSKLLQVLPHRLVPEVQAPIGATDEEWPLGGTIF